MVYIEERLVNDIAVLRDTETNKIEEVSYLDLIEMVKSGKRIYGVEKNKDNDYTIGNFDIYKFRRQKFEMLTGVKILINDNSMYDIDVSDIQCDTEIRLSKLCLYLGTRVLSDNRNARLKINNKVIIVLDDDLDFSESTFSCVSFFDNLFFDVRELSNPKLLSNFYCGIMKHCFTSKVLDDVIIDDRHRFCLYVGRYIIRTNMFFADYNIKEQTKEEISGVLYEDCRKEFENILNSGIVLKKRRGKSFINTLRSLSEFSSISDYDVIMFLYNYSNVDRNILTMLNGYNEKFSKYNTEFAERFNRYLNLARILIRREIDNVLC